jgi:CxxC motif-containing protein (DUF1111 family)
VIIIVMTFSCDNFFPESSRDDQILDGPVEGLTADQRARFIQGDVAFNDEIFNPLNGLGPAFVSTSCGSCHPGDGKGHPFTTLTRFGQTDTSGNHFVNKGGPQLQNRAIPGFQPEVLPPGVAFSKFTPPANTGLGFIEGVSDADILAMADPTDLNGDGVSGEVSWILLPSFVGPSPDNISKNGRYVGRFGKKAGAFNLLHQTVNAYIQDMGITTDYHQEELLDGNNVKFNDNVPDPELPQLTVDNVVFYLKTLKAPIQRQQSDAEIIAGKNLFLQIGCETCHRQTLKTGASPIAPLSKKEFHPYTDLLLHDMGSGLDDGYTEGSAKTFEWRTPPLWGLGLSRNSQGGDFFLLHDGRASTVDQAILLHGGEGKKSRDKFESLSADDKKKLITFLEAL